MRIIKLYIQIIDNVSEYLGRCVSVLLPAMVFALSYEVVARYVFKSPTVWAFDMAIFMFGYCGLLSGAYVLKHHQHISVDLVYDKFSSRGKAVADVVTGLLLFFFILLVIIYGWQEALKAIVNGDRRPTEWGPPIGHFKLMIPLSAFLILLQGVANWIRSLYLVLTGKELKI